MRLAKPVALIAIVCCASGCINSSTLINVKKDGSGTIEQTLLINAAALKGLLIGANAQGQLKTSPPLGEEDFKKAAAGMGKGVRFVSSTPMSQGTFEGAQALFAFDDINELRITQDPGAGTPMGAQPGKPPGTPVKFTFVRGATSSVLTIAVEEKTLKPGTSAGAPSPGAPDTMDPVMLQMMKQLFQGFKVAMDIAVDGTIVKTNADYVNGSRITLLEIEMEGLLKDEAKLRALQGKAGGSLEDIRPLLKDVQGVKMNHAVVTVEFQ